MLAFPPNHIYKLIAIDPGGHKTGVSIFYLDLSAKKILSIYSWTIHVDKLKNDTGLMEDHLRGNFLAYYKLRNEFLRTLKLYQPDIVAYEAPFMNKLQPTAYGPLVSMMTLIYDALITYNQGVQFYTIQPQQTKKAVGVAGKKGKDVIKEAVSKIPELMDALANGECELDDLDDNAIDSIAVGYHAVKFNIFQGVPS